MNLFNFFVFNVFFSKQCAFLTFTFELTIELLFNIQIFVAKQRFLRISTGSTVGRKTVKN